MKTSNGMDKLLRTVCAGASLIDQFHGIFVPARCVYFLQGAEQEQAYVM
jgi:hypothetical protein